MRVKKVRSSTEKRDSHSDASGHGRLLLVHQMVEYTNTECEYGIMAVELMRDEDEAGSSQPVDKVSRWRLK
jgi:hypothetical protein